MQRVVDVGFVEHHQRVGGRGADELAQCIGADPRAGRVVRVGDEHQARVGLDGARERGQVVPVGHRRAGRVRGGREAPCPGRADHDRVDRETILRIHAAACAREECLGQQHQQVIRAVADGQPFARHAKVARERDLEAVRAAIGVEPQLGQRALDRRHCRGAHAPGILVGGELYDVVHAVLALELGDGLARHVALEALHGRRSQRARMGCLLLHAAISPG
jgi:hypothetical protein